MKNRKAIVYTRVSTDEQVQEGVSLDAQESRARAYCIAQGYEVIEVIRDEGQSAKTLDRPGLQKCLSILETQSGAILVFYKLDRLTRSVRDLGTILDRMGETGFEIASVLDSVDTATATGRLQLNIMVCLAQWEREVIVERTREAHAHKRQKCEKNGGSRPFGYDVEMREGTKALVPNTREQSTIKLAQELRDNGLSLAAICKELRRRKRTNASGKTNWRPMCIKRILDRSNRT